MRARPRVTPRTRAIVPVHLYGQPAATWTRSWPWPRARGTRRRRGLLPGAPGDERGRAGGHARHRRRVQLLSRPRTSARWATAARSSPTTRRSPRASAGCATAVRPTRYDHVEAGHQQPARRDAGRHAARPAAADSPMPRRARRSLAAAYRATPDPPGARPSPNTTPVTSIICFRYDRARGTPCSRISARRGIETLMHYPVPLSDQPAFAAVPSRRVPGGRQAAARAALAAAASAARRRRGATVADAVNDVRRKGRVLA